MRKFIPVIPPLTSFADARLVLQNALSDITDRWLQWVNAPSFGGNRVTGVGDPNDSTDAANKAYVDRVAGAQSADSTGLLAASSIPPPTAGGRGGIKTQAAVTSQWVTAINGNGTVSLAQPAFTDISGALADSQLLGANKVQIAYMGSGQSLTGSFADLTGASLTLAKSGVYHLVACFIYISSGVGPATFHGQIVANGVGQSGDAEVSTNASGFAYQATTQAVFTAAAGQVVKLQAYNSAAAGSAATNTSLAAVWLGS